MEQDELLERETGSAALPAPIPTDSGPPPAPASGLYGLHAVPLGTPLPRPGAAPPGIRPVRSEELRLDVDGRYPQMAASGTIRGKLVSRIHWIARLRAVKPDRWTGAIWFKDGAVVSFPYTRVDVTAVRSPFPSARRARVTFSGGGAPRRTVTYAFRSPFYHPASFEFDHAPGEAATTVVDTCAHPNRPGSLPCETLSIEDVFRRAGFAVTTSSGAVTNVPPGGTWSDMELHDAMQRYWSRYASKAQWALWVLFASLHETGPRLGGIMFDDIGPQHRQGTALFVDSFIANAPASDADPAAWVERMRFWTACHEMGHAFNLAHAWQKSLGAGWVPLADEPEARSFMNYPYVVKGGQAAFFSTFEYRFSDAELLFMRHAPERFVQMGSAAWFDHHGFEEADVAEEPQLTLEVRVNRQRPTFEFMEPVVLELKLKNGGDRPVLVERHALAEDAVTLVIKKEGRPARRLVPFARRCEEPDVVALVPGQALYEPLFASAGLNGWDLADPGTYSIQASVRVGDEDVVSAPFRLRVAPPASRQEEFLAQDLFGEEAGRILAVGGSRELGHGIATLEEVVERVPGRRIALHARLALGTPLARRYKALEEKGDVLAVTEQPARPDDAKGLVGASLVEEAGTAADSLGHVAFNRLLDGFATWLAEQGEPEEAVRSLAVLEETLASRNVPGQTMPPAVIEAVAEKREAIAGTRKGRARSRA